MSRIVYPKSLKWKPGAVHVKASEFANNGRVLVRIQYYRDRIAKKIEEKYDLEIDDLLQGLYNIAFNDPAEMYDETCNIKGIHDIPEHIRKTLVGIKHGVAMRKVCEKDGVEICEPVAIIEEYRQEKRIPALEKLLEYKLNAMNSAELKVVTETEVNKKQLARELLLIIYEANAED